MQGQGQEGAQVPHLFEPGPPQLAVPPEGMKRDECGQLLAAGRMRIGLLVAGMTM